MFLGIANSDSRVNRELLGVVQGVLPPLTDVITDFNPLTHLTISGQERFLVTSTNLGAIACYKYPENDRFSVTKYQK